MLTEKELAQGYCNILFAASHTVPQARFAWLLELKYLAGKPGSETVERAFKEANQQLERYASDGEELSAAAHREGAAGGGARVCWSPEGAVSCVAGHRHQAEDEGPAGAPAEEEGLTDSALARKRLGRLTQSKQRPPQASGTPRLAPCARRRARPRWQQ